nr:myb-like protein X [Lytechinus pictus]
MSDEPNLVVPKFQQNLADFLAFDEYIFLYDIQESQINSFLQYLQEQAGVTEGVTQEEGGGERVIVSDGKEDEEKDEAGEVKKEDMDEIEEGEDKAEKVVTQEKSAGGRVMAADEEDGEDKEAEEGKAEEIETEEMEREMEAEDDKSGKPVVTQEEQVEEPDDKAKRMEEKFHSEEEQMETEELVVSDQTVEAKEEGMMAEEEKVKAEEELTEYKEEQEKVEKEQMNVENQGVAAAAAAEEQTVSVDGEKIEAEGKPVLADEKAQEITMASEHGNAEEEEMPVEKKQFLADGAQTEAEEHVEAECKNSEVNEEEGVAADEEQSVAAAEGMVEEGDAKKTCADEQSWTGIEQVEIDEERFEAGERTEENRGKLEEQMETENVKAYEEQEGDIDEKVHIVSSRRRTKWWKLLCCFGWSWRRRRS